MNAFIYARASSGLPSARTIVDQIASCRGHCERNGWAVVGGFDDKRSGNKKLEQKESLGLRALLGRIEEGGIDYVVIESMDRIARDPGDASAIQKHIERAGARLIGVSESEGTDIAAAILALFDTAFRDDQIARIKRGTCAAVAARRGDASR
ncbi:hypothetical protein SPAN111604_13025 [Sphingomonas antarctica]|uniref:recombinase family protein n=1 Tax=Sphingomonas antarctica TaxID=2040274 RepID=UPI0039ECB6F8